jgi:hypothetical protein
VQDADGDSYMVRGIPSRTSNENDGHNNVMDGGESTAAVAGPDYSVLVQLAGKKKRLAVKAIAQPGSSAEDSTPASCSMAVDFGRSHQPRQL